MVHSSLEAIGIARYSAILICGRRTKTLRFREARVYFRADRNQSPRRTVPKEKTDGKEEDFSELVRTEPEIGEVFFI